MKIALISDIHGNLQALQAVLRDIEDQQIVDIIFLGDAATLGPQPREVIAVLQGLDCLLIRGNHDAFVTGQDSVTSYTAQPEVIALVEWCGKVLDRGEKAYLSSFAAQQTVSLPDGQSLLCFHGSPRSHNENIFPDITDSEIEALLGHCNQTVYAFGHTHLPMVRRYQDKLLVNSGSVGGPFWEKPVSGPPRIVNWAEYAVLECNNGQLSATLKRIGYDFGAFKVALAASHMPGKEEWLNYWNDTGS